MKILGISALAHDTSAALMVDGRLVAACEQERYCREKHTKRFPNDAINDCLNIAGLTINDIDVVASGGNSRNMIRRTYLRSALADHRRVGMLIEENEKVSRAYHLEEVFRKTTNFQGVFREIDHHLCHMASTYYPSQFENAIILSIDGVGDNKSLVTGIGKGDKIRSVDFMFEYPNSLGQVYAAITTFLGWQSTHHEGVIMALASYGDSSHIVPSRAETYYEVFSEIIHYDGNQNISVSQDWFDFFLHRDRWVSDQFIELFGQRRAPEEPISQHHMDIAAALQKRLEDVVIGLLSSLKRRSNLPNLCLAGGVALNCAMNGKISQSNLFDQIYITPAAGDAGLSVGACYLAHTNKSETPKIRGLKHFFLGSRFDDAQIEKALSDSSLTYTRSNNKYIDTSKALANGDIVGWFQGAAEFGPRALGNRSILARPFPDTMKDHINEMVKFREMFRPFAPAILEEHLADYFEINQNSPFMLIACKVREDKRLEIPATIHIDDTCRVETVNETYNSCFYQLLSEFHTQTECPVLLNTSFNIKGEPIVNSPADAIRCFSTTKIDLLVIGDFLVSKSGQSDIV